MATIHDFTIQTLSSTVVNESPSSIFSINQTIVENSSNILKIYTFKYSLIKTLIIIGIIECLSIITTLGNLTVFIAFIKDPKLKTVHNYYILNLAFCDFITGTVTTQLGLVEVLFDKWPLNEMMCKIWIVLDYVLAYESVLSVILINRDSHLLITKPLHYAADQTPRRAFVKIVTTWILSLLLYVPVTIFGSNLKGQICQINIYNFAYAFTALIVELLVPVFTIIFLNIEIYWSLRKRSQTFIIKRSYPCIISTICNANSNSLQSSTYEYNYSQVQKNKLNSDALSNDSKISEPSLNQLQKIAWSLIILVGVFIAFWAPFSIFVVYKSLCQECPTRTVYVIFYWILYYNSAVNPFIYALAHKRFSYNFKKIWCMNK